MRIISQDGRVDIPYDKVMVEIEPEKKTDIIVSTPEMAAMGQGFVAAEYSTPEKAKKAFQMLLFAYEYHDKKKGKTFGGGKFYAPEFRFIPPKVFRFPADAEVK